MTINQRIISALASFGEPVQPTTYRKDSGTPVPDSYYVFNYDTVGASFGDDAPEHERYLVQVHYICRATTNSTERKRQTKRALFHAGFSWPDMFHASEPDNDWQHIVFECEYAMEA